jgi:hypothetical protein
MRCYLISRGGEPLALVTQLSMAQAIAGCQPSGYYLLEEVDIPELFSGRVGRQRKSAIGHQGGGGRGRLKKRPVRRDQSSLTSMDMMQPPTP